MADFEITGTGGGVGGGAAEILFLPTFAIVGSGGGKGGGAATLNFIGSYAIVGTGGGKGGGAAVCGGNTLIVGTGGGKGGGEAKISFSASVATTNLDAIVLTIENLARYHYANFAFDSLISYKGNIYGTLGGVFYQLTGTTDAGADIVTTLRTGQNDFGVTEKKNVPDVYVNAKTAGAMTCKSITDNAVESSAISIPASTFTDMAPRRAKMPLGRMSRLWGQEIANVSGVAVEIDSVEMIPDGGTRKI